MAIRTEAQKEASRRNGAKSRGPISLAGKRTVSTNARTHGVLTSAITLKCELKQSFLNIVAALHREFQPQSPFEESLLEMMAAARWQYSRVWCMFSAGMDHEMDRQAAAPDAPQDQWATCSWLSFKSLGDTSRTLDLMLRYETHYSRQYLRAHRRLMEVRGQRNPPAPGPFLVPDRLPQPDPEKTPIAEQTWQSTANKANQPAQNPATQYPEHAEIQGRAATSRVRREHEHSLNQKTKPASPNTRLRRVRHLSPANRRAWRRQAAAVVNHDAQRNKHIIDG